MPTPDANKTVPVALSIAGSDPSGGAGIQADIKTFTVIGVYAGAVITALTAQNTLGVTSFLPLPPSFVRSQIEAVLADLNVTHIKIGMVGDGDLAAMLGEILQEFTGEVVYDPVLTASSGDSLFSSENRQSVIWPIIKVCTVLTPNTGELENLTGRQCPEPKMALDAAKLLFKSSDRLQAVCLKGGHMLEQEKQITDYLIEKIKDPGTGQERLHISKALHPRYFTPNSHGTGCTFAAAYTAFLLQKKDHRKAFYNTVNFINELLQKSSLYHIGHGRGPLLHHLFDKK